MIPCFCKTHEDKDPTHMFMCGCGCDATFTDAWKKAVEGIKLGIKMH